tara:strand:+ start:708 stop:1058 length:351 start_codon:yes stop_codon:yes gene_type:complete
MALYAIIEDNIVSNMAVSDTALEDNWFLVDDTVKIGDTKDGDTYTSAPPSEEGMRAIRDRLLAEDVDPIVINSLRWAELTDAKQTEWTQYRTDLLNVPQQSGFPTNITWPNKPSST